MMMKIHDIACTVSILTFFTISGATPNVVPASSEYPQSSGPIWFDPATTIKNTHIALKKYPVTKEPMYSIVNDNIYEICVRYGVDNVACISTKSENWGNIFRDVWAICPAFYSPVNVDTKKIFTRGSGKYTCLLQGSPEWQAMSRI